MLFAEINEKETCRMIDHFFKYRLDHYLNLSGNRRYALRSPMITGMPKANSNINRQDETMMRIFHAEKVVQSVSKSINNCTNTTDKPYKSILIGYYFDLLPLNKVGDKVGYKGSKLSRLKRQALLEFSDRFTGIQQANKVEPLIDLTVYDSDLKGL